MSKGAENVVQNIGAIAETTSIFYNTIIKQVPKDVALILTQHFMDITISKRPANPSAAAAAALAAARAAEERRRAAAAAEQNRRAPAPSDGVSPAADPKAPGGPLYEAPKAPESPDQPETEAQENPAGPDPAEATED